MNGNKVRVVSSW